MTETKAIAVPLIGNILNPLPYQRLLPPNYPAAIMKAGIIN